MRLLQRTNRIYLLLSAALLLLVCGLTYVGLTKIDADETTEKLLVNTRRITAQLAAGEAVPSLPPVLIVERLPAREAASTQVKDTVVFDPIEGEEETFREVRSIVEVNEATYLIILRQVILEPHDYFDPLGLALVVASVLLLSGLRLINTRISRKLWAPFHRTLESLRGFNLRNERSAELMTSDITEFNELNEAVSKLTARIRSDHRALKEFTANASHEMQTPLAIAQARIEEAMSATDLPQAVSVPIKAAHASVLRLSRLHQSLLLLGRIDSGQFHGTERIDLGSAVEALLEHYGELIRAKGITVDTELDHAATIMADPLLLEALLGNLLGNAITHNMEGGRITITMAPSSFTIANTGSPLAVPAQELFERFRKADATSASSGLGLSIVKSICDAAGWRIDYSEQEGWHSLRLTFEQQDLFRSPA